MELIISQIYKKNYKYYILTIQKLFILICLLFPFSNTMAENYSEYQFLDLVEKTAEQTDTFNSLEYLPDNYRVIDGVLFDGTILYKYPAKKSLADYVIPDGTTGISKNAFTYQEATSPCFRSLYIPASCISLGWDTNYECKDIIGPLWYLSSEYIVSENNPLFSSYDGVLYSKNMDRLLLYPSENIRSHFAIPMGVKQIGAYAFDSSIFLSSVVISETVECIGEGAFYNCYSLKSINLSKNLTIIADYAFQHCQSLEKIHFPLKLRFIGYSAFQACSCITSIDLPSSLSSLEDYAFYGCSISAIVLPASLDYIGNNTFGEKSALFIEVFEDSYAQKWCEENLLNYKTILANSAYQVMVTAQ